MDELWTKLVNFGAEYGLQVLGAIVIFVVGRWVAKLLRNVVRRLLTKAKVDATLVSFVGHLVYVLLMTFIIVAILSNLGVETTSFIAVIGAAGLAVGLALQGSLANFAAGVLLVIFRPLKVGDFVEGGGQVGTVEEVGIFTTTLVSPDNRVVTVPNAKLTSDNIINYTEKGTRRVDLVVGVSYAENLKHVKEVIVDELSKDARVLAEPAPTVGVVELADRSVNFAVRPWTGAADYWNVYFDTLAALKTRFDKEGISIPFPQRDVHMIAAG
ncbi:MAG TPA: mechanosensitive ion channel domain-containing protein [Planctomycetota bacterium]|nr:mechanosensitive ion channel domain-containing protein [Planctomycetota bacterium]